MSDQVKLTCNMTNVEFCEYVSERCEMTLRNTAAGEYMRALMVRLLSKTLGPSDTPREVEQLAAENERLREALASPCSYSYQAGGRCCGCKNCRRIKALQRGEDDE